MQIVNVKYYNTYIDSPENKELCNIHYALSMNPKKSDLIHSKIIYRIESSSALLPPFHIQHISKAVIRCFQDIL